MPGTSLGFRLVTNDGDDDGDGEGSTDCAFNDGMYEDMLIGFVDESDVGCSLGTPLGERVGIIDRM